MTMKLYYVANARMPSEKAHGIQIAKTCEAFIEAGVPVTLVIPGRAGAATDLQTYYGLRVSVPVHIVPVLDWYRTGPIGFAIASLTFMIGSFRFVRSVRAPGSVVYTVDMDTFSSAFLPLAGMPCISEMHGVKPRSIFTRALFNRVSGIIAINQPIADALKKCFSFPARRMLVEGNAADAQAYENKLSREEARQQCGLPQEARIALYAGRLYGWKEPGILAAAARALPPEFLLYFVGGTGEMYEALTGEVPPSNLRFIADVPSYEMPRWLAAADVLVVLGSRKTPESYRYTSPMKAYEYLLANRPIVASDTPALRCIYSDAEAVFYTPDDASSLAKSIQNAWGDTARADAALRLGQQHTWKARAARILAFITSVATLDTHG